MVRTTNKNTTDSNPNVSATEYRTVQNRIVSLSVMVTDSSTEVNDSSASSSHDFHRSLTNARRSGPSSSSRGGVGVGVPPRTMPSPLLSIPPELDFMPIDELVVVVVEVLVEVEEVVEVEA